MFAVQVFGKIKQLISNLNSTNLQDSEEKIQNILRMYSNEDDRVPYISSLLDEIETRDQRINIPDDLKIQTLQKEIINSTKKPNRITQICLSFESGNRTKYIQQNNKIMDDYASSMCKLLKFSPGTYVTIGYCLFQSQNRSISMDGLKMIKLKLNEIIPSGSISDIPEDVLPKLIQLVAEIEELSAPEISEGFFTALSNTQYSSFITAILNNSASNKNKSDRFKEDNNFRQVNIATHLEELGTKCASSAETFRNTLKSIGIRIDEYQLANIIITIIYRPQYNNSENGDGDNKKNELGINWNFEVMADVLGQECQALNWGLVGRNLDQPNFVLRSETEFHLLTGIFVRIAGRPIPGAGLIERWDNKVAQLTVLTLAANAPRNIVDFSELVSMDSFIKGNDIPCPSNFSWLCLPIFSRFFELAASGLLTEVLDILNKAAASYPEYFILALAQVQDVNNCGIRQELLRRLLPLFTGLQGSSKPSSLVVMQRLYTVNPDLLVLLCRIAFKKAKKVVEILNIDRLLKSFNPNIVRKLEMEGAADELLSYYCVKADIGEVNLEEKTVNLLEQNAKNARLFVSFTKMHAESLRPRMSQEEGILSFECFAVLLRAVQGYPSIVPIEEVRGLATLFPQRQQQIPVPQQQHSMQQEYRANAPTAQQQSLPSNLMSNNESHNINQLNTDFAVASTNQNPAGVNPALSDGFDYDRMPPGPEADEIEKAANSYFQKIYKSDISIMDVIVLLRQFKSSNEKRDQEIFRCMIQNLFDEYRFFHKYPDRELQVTGKLFGALIQNQLISSITLGIALRYVLEALRKEPDLGNGAERSFRFGKIAAEQFKSRLVEWPQYCSHLVQIPHLQRHCPELFHEAQKVVNAPIGNQSAPNQQIPISPQTIVQTSSLIAQQQVSQSLMQQSHMLQHQQTPLSDASALIQSNLNASNLSNPSIPKTNQTHSIAPITNLVASNLPPTPSPMLANPIHDQTNIMAQQLLAMSLSSESHAVGFKTSTPASLNATAFESPYMSSAPLPQLRQTSGSISLPESNQSVASMDLNEIQGEKLPISVHPEISEIDRMATVNVDVVNTVMPPEATRDQIIFVINNIAKNNLETKCNEIKNVLKSEYFNWFSNYLVVKRISTQPNLHSLYLSVLDALDYVSLGKLVLDSAYHNVTKLLQSPQITTSSSERSLLRNLGTWLGQMTLARNKPLLQKRINLKELLFWGFETGRLIAVCSFVAKTVEGVKDSKVFRPPNPWLMALLGIMRELYEIDDLKLNIKFEVQVLCRNINIRIEDIPKSNSLSKRRQPIKDSRNPDFNVKQSQSSLPSGGSSSPVTSTNSPVVTQGSPPVMTLTTSQPLPSANTGGSSNSGVAMRNDEDESKSRTDSQITSQSQLVTDINQSFMTNLSSYIAINPSLTFFTSNPNHRRLVLVAVDRGLREIISSTVERSVSTATTTTKNLILKDFATEGNEQILRNAAISMVSVLAGSLAMATCKEPLRISIGNHLRLLLSQVISDQVTIEQLVQICSNDNVELGTILIEKAAIEKATRDVDEVFSSAIQARKKFRESGGQQFVDATYMQITGRFPGELNDALKPRPGGLQPQQLQVYEAFKKLKTLISSGADQQMMNSTTNSPATAALITTPLHQGISSIPALESKLLPPSVAASVQSTGNFSMSQSLEAYQILLSRIDVVLKGIQAQFQGREVSLTMLGNEHEILLIMRDIILITQKTHQSARNETSMTFSENVFKRMFDSIASSAASSDTLRLEVYVAILEAVRDACGGAKEFSPDCITWLNNYGSFFNSNDESSRKVYKWILIQLTRAKLIRPLDLDIYFANYTDGGRNFLWLDLAISFIRQCLAENLCVLAEFAKTIEVVDNIKTPNATFKKQLQKILLDLKTLSSNQQEQKQLAIGSNIVAPTTAPISAAVQNSTTKLYLKDSASREQATSLLDHWLQVWVNIKDQQFGHYLQLMHQCGVLKTEEAADRFFRNATEICVEACLKPVNAQVSTSDAITPPSLNFVVIDALSRLFLLLLRLADKESSDSTARVKLLTRILTAVVRSLVDDHETKKLNKQVFDQRPYFRLLSHLSQDLGIPDAKQEPNPTTLQQLLTYSQAYLYLHPSAVPGFAFAWVQLISRRSFMPHLLLAKGQKGWPIMHRLLTCLLQFLQPFLKASQLSEAIRRMYKGTLRILLVLLHDFPEFLCDYHLSFCEMIPTNCVQLRNLILSAFPRSMRLPDPFTPNLKVEVLQDIQQSPRILTDYMTPINGIKMHLETYMTSKAPAELPLKLPSILSNSSGYNVTLINSLIMYLGSLAIAQQQNNQLPFTSSPAMDIFKQFSAQLDSEGRYIVFNAMANQLRYPNSHTHFFSATLLHLFSETDSVYAQEQITRVLLERLIVHRPHPWGLLITFIELIKNPKYLFWRKPFIRSVPEMERVFESIARSCIGPNAQNIIQQQLNGSVGSE